MRQDDLFRPSVAERSPVLQPPYRLAPMVYVGFFGGPLALLHVARPSAARLHEPASRQRLVLVTCLGALVLALTAAAVLGRAGAEDRVLRYTVQAAGVLAYLVVAALLRPGQRRFELAGGAHERLGFGRGLLICLGWGLVQAVLLLAVIGLVR